MLSSLLVLVFASSAMALEFSPVQIIEANSTEIAVDSYSAPAMADVNGDGLADLIVGEKTALSQGKVRLYLNDDSGQSNAFSDYTYIQAGRADLTVDASGCMGAFPRAVDWTGDGLIDLLVGDAYGRISLFRNVGSTTAPSFEAAETMMLAGATTSSPIDVGSRATLDVVDWNGDGALDLLTGAYDGLLRIYSGRGDSPAELQNMQVLSESLGGGSFDTPTGRSSPAFADLTGDGLDDLLLGNTQGQLLLYENIGLPGTPAFYSDQLYEPLTSEGQPIQISLNSRTRPFVTDWDGDGLFDVLVGAADGKVRLYQGIPEPAGITLFGLALVHAVRRPRRVVH
jgi:hypothetical protein